MKRAEKMSDRMGIISRLEERNMSLLKHVRENTQQPVSNNNAPCSLHVASTCSLRECITAMMGHTERVPAEPPLWQHLDAEA